MHEGRQSVKPDDSRNVNYTATNQSLREVLEHPCSRPRFCDSSARGCLIATALSNGYLRYEVSNDNHCIQCMLLWPTCQKSPAST